MKVAVSIPDPVFAATERLIQDWGTTRSALYARALDAFVAEHAPDRVTEAMNKVFDDLATESDPVIDAGARQVLRHTEW